MGILLADAHVFSHGAARGSKEYVSGRSGYVWLGAGETEDFDIKRICRAPKSRVREISAWLIGNGGLRFSNEQNLMYDARIIKEIVYKCIYHGADPIYEFTVTFSCQPFPKLWPEVEPIVITETFTSMPNPGTAPSQPRIEIIGSGSFSLTIGMQTMFFTDVEDGIIVDSELMDALTLDGSLLANEKISGDFFEIQPGPNVVQWLEGGIDEEDESVPGSVEKVTITPRWRCT